MDCGKPIDEAEWDMVSAGFVFLFTHAGYFMMNVLRGYKVVYCLLGYSGATLVNICFMLSLELPSCIC